MKEQETNEGRRYIRDIEIWRFPIPITPLTEIRSNRTRYTNDFNMYIPCLHRNIWMILGIITTAHYVVHRRHHHHHFSSSRVRPVARCVTSDRLDVNTRQRGKRCASDIVFCVSCSSRLVTCTGQCIIQAPLYCSSGEGDPATRCTEWNLHQSRRRKHMCCQTVIL